MRRLLVVVACFCCAQISLAQNTDSLTVVGYMNRLRKQINTDITQGKVIMDSLKIFIDSKPKNAFFEGEYNKIKGIFFYRTSQYDSALIFYTKSLEAYRSIKDEKNEAKLLVNISMVNNRTGAYDKAIEYALAARKLFEAQDDTKGIGLALNMIGQVYFLNSDYKKALEIFKQYLKNSQIAGDSTEIASGYSNTASAFSELLQFDSTLYYQRLGLLVHSRLGNQYGIANAYQNMGALFNEKLDNKDSALYYYLKASEIYSKVNNNSGLTESKVNIGLIYTKAGQYQKAISFLESALALAKEIDESFLTRESYQALSTAYEKTGNTVKALSYFKLYHALNDSLFNENNRKNIEELNTKYETEKKEQQILVQQYQLSEQQAELERTYILIGALILTILFVIVLYVMLRNRSRRKQQILEKEKLLSVREAFIQASIQSQETERKRFAQDLHDGMGQLISAVRLSLLSVNKNSTLEERLEVASKAESLLNEMHREIRSIAFNLMPQTLVQQGLTPALREMADRVNQSGQVTVRVSSFDIPQRLEEVQEISLYRMIQEWVNNVMKYAKASVVEVQLVGYESEISITIEDNGEGFDASILQNGGGNGWKNINSRLNLLKGNIDIDSTPGRRGSTFIIRVPLKITETANHAEMVKN